MSLTQDADSPGANEDPRVVTQVLDAIDQLLDAMEAFEAPITRELLRSAMLALVQECQLQPGGSLH